MKTSDYDRWFISTDPSLTAVKCRREKFIDYLIDLVGKTRAMEIHPMFRRATFAENCKLELQLQEDTL